MRSIIGEYASWGQAARAVHELERHLSVQDVILVARSRAPRSKRSTRSGEWVERDSDVLVLMSGDAAHLARARELIRSPSAHAVAPSKP